MSVSGCCQKWDSVVVRPLPKGKKKGKKSNKVKDIPPHSPLGKLLENWDKDDRRKGLDWIKMVRYGVEEWPLEVIQEGPYIGLGMVLRKDGFA